MKKGRPGSLLRVIARPEDRESLARMVFAETSTLGLRTYGAERIVEARRLVQVETKYGPVHVKVSASGNVAPEYEDCRSLARAGNVALKDDPGRSHFRIPQIHSMKYYITTPLYYVNAAPHIGHTYSTLAADTIKRVKRMQGFEAVLTTGTDEHGQKVERSAEACGRTPKEFVDMVSGEFRRQWDALHVSYDHFVRTTDPSTSKPCNGCSSAAKRTATFIRAVIPANTASPTNCM